MNFKPKHKTSSKCCRGVCATEMFVCQYWSSSPKVSVFIPLSLAGVNVGVSLWATPTQLKTFHCIRKRMKIFSCHVCEHSGSLNAVQRKRKIEIYIDECADKHLNLKVQCCAVIGRWCDSEDPLTWSSTFAGPFPDHVCVGVLGKLWFPGT